MATKLIGSALTVTITESLNVANSTAADSLDFAQTTTMSFADIVNVDKRIIKLANTNVTTIANFDTTESMDFSSIWGVCIFYSKTRLSEHPNFSALICTSQVYFLSSNKYGLFPNMVSI